MERALTLTSPDEAALRVRCLTNLGYNELNRATPDVAQGLAYADQAKQLNPKSAGPLGLIGYFHLVKARSQPDATQMLADFDAAVKNCESAATDEQAGADDRVRAHVYLSMALLEQANYRHFFLEERPEVTRALLTRAAKEADQAKRLSQVRLKDLSLKAEGNAAEDLAYFCRDDIQSNFTKAGRAFVDAVLATPADPDFMVSKGRCYFRCARVDAGLSDDEVRQVAMSLKDVNLTENSRAGMFAEAESIVQQSLLFGDGHLEALDVAGQMAFYHAQEAKKAGRSEDLRRFVVEADQLWTDGFEKALERRDTTMIFIFVDELLASAVFQEISDRPRRLLNRLQQIVERPETLTTTAYYEPVLACAMLEAKALTAEGKRDDAFRAMQTAMRPAVQRRSGGYSFRQLAQYELERAKESLRAEIEAGRAVKVDELAAWISEIVEAVDRDGIPFSERARARHVAFETELLLLKHPNINANLFIQRQLGAYDQMERVVQCLQSVPRERRSAEAIAWCSRYCAFSSVQARNTQLNDAQKKKFLALTVVAIDFAQTVIDDQFDSARSATEEENLSSFRAIFGKYREAFSKP